jgi:hypothetical protein
VATVDATATPFDISRFAVGAVAVVAAVGLGTACPRLPAGPPTVAPAVSTH